MGFFTESKESRLLPFHCGCRSTNKEAMRRICSGLLPLKAELQAIRCNPSRPRSQPRNQAARMARGSGGIAGRFPQRLSAAFAVESGASHALQAAEMSFPSNQTDAVWKTFPTLCGLSFPEKPLFYCPKQRHLPFPITNCIYIEEKIDETAILCYTVGWSNMAAAF